MMPAEIEASTMWSLNEDGMSVRMRLPALPLEGLPEPLRIEIDFEADAIDEMLLRLTVLRSQMQPPPPRS